MPGHALLGGAVDDKLPGCVDRWVAHTLLPTRSAGCIYKLYGCAAFKYGMF